MGKKRRHHFVPQSLSRHFTYDGKMLFLYDVDKDVTVEVSTRDAFVTKDLYSYNNKYGEFDTETIENGIMLFENKFGSSLSSLALRRELDPDTRMWIAAFIAFQWMRTPTVWSNMAQMYVAALRSTVRLLERQGKLPPIPNALQQYGRSLDEMISKGFIEIDQSGPVKGSGLFCLANVPYFADIIRRMNWTVMQSENTNYFIISDNPVSFYSRDALDKNIGIGLSNQDIEVVLPITRNMALLLSWRDMPPMITVSQKKVDEVNRRLAFFADRFLGFPIHSRSMIDKARDLAGIQPRGVVNIFQLPNGGEIIAFRNYISDEVATRRAYRSFSRLAKGNFVLDPEELISQLRDARRRDRQ